MCKSQTQNRDKDALLISYVIMPPKAKAAKRVKPDAQRVSHPVVEAPLPGTKELTGLLSLLVSRSIPHLKR